jgi:cell division protein FtsW
MKKKFNYFLFFLTIFLVAFGFLFLAALSSRTSFERFGNTYYYLMHQLLVGIIPGIVLAFIAYKIPLQYIKKISPILLIISLVTLVLVLLPFLGLNAGGASRWLKIGIFSFQPSEFLKITAILYLSAWIASKLSEDNVKGWKLGIKKGYHNIMYVLLPFLVFLATISFIMFFQRDVTTLGIIGLILIVIYFSARTPFWHTFSIIAVAVSGLFFLIRFESYRLDRWLIFLNPESDPLGKGFQLRQSLISLGSGGIFGKGLGMSTQKFGYLPQAMSDSIFAILGEELGIIGCVILVGLFVLFFWLGIRIVKKSSDRFAKLAATGITFWIVLQAFVNIGSIIGILPVSGVPLPFFSYGGSHIVAELIGVGLLLNISKNS